MVAKLHCTICEEMTAHFRMEGEWVCNNYEDH